LFLGGSRDLVLDGQYERLSKYIMEKSFNLYDNHNITLPIWGTCQGLELFHVLIANTIDALGNFNAENMRLPLNFTNETSKMYDYFSENDKEILKNTEILPNLHHLGIYPETYDKYPILKEYFIINSLSKDRDGNTFVNSIEGKRYPFIYAVQFHPELIPYSQFEINNAPSSVDAADIYQRFGKFFLSQTLLNNNTMSEEDLQKYDFVDSFTLKPVDFGDRWFYYVFQKNKENKYLK